MASGQQLFYDPKSGLMYNEYAPGQWYASSQSGGEQPQISGPPPSAVPVSTQWDANGSPTLVGPDGSQYAWSQNTSAPAHDLSGAGAASGGATPFTLGFESGLSPQDITNQISNTAQRDSGYLQGSVADAQKSLSDGAYASFQGGSNILDNSYQTQARQGALGAQGLAQSQGLADYYGQLGQASADGMSQLGAQYNATSGAYGAQGQAQLGQQQDFAAAGLDQLGQLRAQSAQAVNALYGSADDASRAQGYYGQQSGQFGQQAQNSQGISAQGYGQLAAQGQSDQAMMSSLGGQANDAANYYGVQGANNAGFAGDERTRALSAVDRLQQFYQQGPGPSAAEAQLRMGADQAQGNALSLAHSGRGAGNNAAALRAAMFSNAATQQTMNMQAAQLRAQEEAAWRGQQLSAMGQEQGTIGNLRGQDIGAAQANAQLSQGFAGLGQQAYGQGAQFGQNATNAAAAGFSGLAGQQLSGQQSTGQLGLGYGQLGQSATQAAGSLGLQSNTAEQGALQNWGGQALSGAQTSGQLGATYAGLGQQAYQSGQQLQQGYGQLGNAALSTGLGYQQGMEGLGNQAANTGVGAYTSQSQQGNGLLSNAAGVGLQGAGQQVALDQASLAQQQGMYGQQLSSDLQKYGIDKNVAVQQQQQDTNKTAAYLQGAATLGAGLLAVASDKRMKRNIRARIFDLRPARGYAYEYKDPSEPGTALGTHFGPMAQDLERSAATRSAVITVGNRKMVDTPRLTMALAGAVSEDQHRADRLSDRIQRLEAMLGGDAA